MKKETGVYYPDYEDSSPHITLYMCRFDEVKYPELLRGLATLEIPKLSFTLSEPIFLEEEKRKQIPEDAKNLKNPKDIGNYWNNS